MWTCFRLYESLREWGRGERNIDGRGRVGGRGRWREGEREREEMRERKGGREMWEGVSQATV